MRAWKEEEGIEARIQKTKGATLAIPVQTTVTFICSSNIDCAYIEGQECAQCQHTAAACRPSTRTREPTDLSCQSALHCTPAGGEGRSYQLPHFSDKLGKHGVCGGFFFYAGKGLM